MPSSASDSRRKRARYQRAQSETIGVILLVGVVTLAISTFGIYYLGAIETNPGPTTNVDSRVTSEWVNLTHDGGDVLNSDELELVVRTNGTAKGIEWSDGGVGDRFDPGETWAFNVSADSDFDSKDTKVRIILVHEPTDSVVFETVTAPETS